MSVYLDESPKCFNLRTRSVVAKSPDEAPGRGVGKHVEVRNVRTEALNVEILYLSVDTRQSDRQTDRLDRLSKAF